jgi:photosystem II stability/assembly factor-like uncharacterized protein
MASRYSSDKNAVWLQRSCTQALEFLGCHDVSDLTIPRGEISSSRKRTGKGTFKVIASRRNTPDNPTVSFRWFRDVVNLIDDLPCAPNILVYYSDCGADEDPTNYDFIDYLEGVNITEVTQAGVVNAIGPDDATDVGVDVVVEASAELDNYFTIKPLLSTALTISALSGRIIDDIAVCDKDASCGECDTSTIGCQTLWIITRGSPGFYGDARIYKSTDGGSTWVEQTNSMTVDTDTLSSVDCDGDVVIISNQDTSEYQVSDDGGTTWTLVTTPTQVIYDIFVLSQTKIWMAAAGGFIYFSDDKGASVSIQEDGTATAQDLNSIHFADSQLGYAVGNSNAFLRTTDGGTNWAAVTGPAVGVNLNVVQAVEDTNILYVGDASGNVYRSTDKGATWATARATTSQVAGGITDIQICECNVVLIAGNDANGLGSVYQSIDGGNSWAKQTTPANGADSINAIDCCNVNTYFGVGDDGLIFKLAGESFRDSVPA